MSERRPVVIAGAGPTGLMCALALRAQNIPVVICEAEPGLTHDLRAGSFHPPTLELMAPYGITAKMLETGIKVRHWQIRSKPGDIVAEFDLGLLADVTPYPHRLHLEQHKLTPIQLELLKRRWRPQRGAQSDRHRIRGIHLAGNLHCRQHAA
jgi:3-(3-hydroxy-phenyl)propionate hydroxylase